MKPSLLRRRADAAGDVHLAVDHVVPDRVERVEQPRVAGQRRHVGHAAVEVHRAHGVAGHLGLLADRLVVLGVFAEQPALVGPAAHVEEELGQLQVVLLVRWPGRA